MIRVPGLPCVLIVLLLSACSSGRVAPDEMVVEVQSASLPVPHRVRLEVRTAFGPTRIVQTRIPARTTTGEAATLIETACRSRGIPTRDGLPQDGERSAIRLLQGWRVVAAYVERQDETEGWVYDDSGLELVWN